MSASHVEQQKQQLKKALQQLDRQAVVVSGPSGCGKTHLIREVCREERYIIAEIENDEEWSDRGLESRRVCLMHVEEIGQIRRKCYTGIVFETDMPYLYRMIPGCIHIKIPRMTHRGAEYLSGVQQGPRNLHKALLAARTSAQARKLIIEEKKESISIYHLIAKILYRKTDQIPRNILDLLSTAPPDKVLLYLHENIPFFVDSLSELADILDSFSLCVSENYRSSRLFQSVCKVWKCPRYTPQCFYSIKSSSFFHKIT